MSDTFGTVKIKDENKPDTIKVDVAIFDETEEATFALWGCTTGSASGWQPSETILFLTNASFKAQKSPTLGLKGDTLVDVDPLMKDAYWLRDYAHGLKKKECANQAFPENGWLIAIGPDDRADIWTVFEIKTAEESEERLLFTLADIDEWWV